MESLVTRLIIFKVVLLITVFVTSDSAIWSQGAKAPARTQSLPKLLESALSDIKVKTTVPILLPAKLPSGITEDSIHYVDVDGNADEYRISLYYEAGIGDAGWAGYFGGQRGKRLYALGKKITLAHGITGFFSPVSCGGSCGPASVYWELNGTLYVAQFKGEDEKGMLAVANSAISAGPR